MVDKAAGLLEGYKVIYENIVDWGDMDAFQHVNNVVYFRYFENVRVVYGIKIGITERMESEGIGPILASTECKYIRPLMFPDTALTGVRVKSIHGSEMRMEYSIASRRQNIIVATGGSLGVFYNYRKKERVNFSEDLIRRIEELEGRKISGKHKG